jgi:hypothetical protein
VVGGDDCEPRGRRMVEPSGVLGVGVIESAAWLPGRPVPGRGTHRRGRASDQPRPWRRAEAKRRSVSPSGRGGVAGQTG